MIDLISGGRLVPGWVRGAGSEQFFNNANPAYNREYFNEAHDFIIAAWTRPGPFRYEGKHFHYPLRQSVGAAVSEAASADLDSRRDQPRDRGVVRRASLSVHRAGHDARADARAVESVRRRARRSMGYQAGPENFGYLQPIFVRRDRREGARAGQGLPLWRRLRAFRAARMDVPAGLQLQGGDQAAGEPVRQSEYARTVVRLAGSHRGRR